ncbi:hypothetical protein K1T71_006112 [Dendrolimus kikuchii]|uniref:Uncharacterized protein n=1 Tax=Dendrolimus kikuchii TaxID=765133 RepID=A0ACC1D2W4_9NEOP|nr:hypothetical protein K1T71_006112 [Dendrolimus kikuchii]
MFICIPSSTKRWYIDCAVCLQKCYHPTRLPCGHVFCFLCVKGVAIQSKKCAMCRAIIPADYLDNPVLLEKIVPEQFNMDEGQDYQWYYEGRNGWWKYDERSNSELESAFNGGDPECTLLLAGALYSIDFQSMTQVRCTDQTRRRKVKRDTPLFPAKGVAGIKTRPAEIKSENETVPVISENIVDNILVLVEDVSEAGVLEPIINNDDDVIDISEQIRTIDVNDGES